MRIVNLHQRLTIVIFFILFISSPANTLFAQQDVNRKLNNAVNGFGFDEAAAKSALANGANINWKNEALGGETLLIVAIKGFKESKVVKFLVDNGADPKMKDNSGKSALDWAEQYHIEKDNNGREILKLLGSKQGTAQQTKQTTAPKTQPVPLSNATTAGGPSIADVQLVVQKQFTTDYEDHFFGVKNHVTFEWSGGIVVGKPERRLRQSVLCYPVKLNVKVSMTDPRDGKTSSVKRGLNAEIGGYHKTEIFCFFKNGFGEWEFGTYEQ
jgi:hypothetical protein